jgi:hypothetical protein
MEKTKKITRQLRQSLFWDVDPKDIDLKRHAQYVIERVLDFGNDDEVRWLWQTYSKRKIRNVVNTSRVLHAKSKALWSLVCA